MASLDAKEIGISAAKALIGLVPFGGNAISEVLFEYRSRVKQNRLNRFTELLGESFEENADFDLESLKTEEFIDVFESVLRKVSQTRSKEKLLRFRDILLRQMRSPKTEIDNADFFLDLIGELDETAIHILKEHAVFEAAFELIDPIRQKYVDTKNANSQRLMRERSKLAAEEVATIEEQNLLSDQKIEQYNNEVQAKQAFRKAEYFELSVDDYLYYKQFLAAKGLIRDNQVGIGGGEPFSYPRITQLGKRFITFIVGEEAN
jgi:hypothetical protein